MAPGSSSTVCPKARPLARLWARRLVPMAMTCWPPCSPRRSGSGCAGCPRSRGCGSSGSSNFITTRAGCAGVVQSPVNQRLHSPYDPDARYAKKRDTSWIGYKVHLTETCEADRPNLITDVQTTAAGTPDGAVTATVQSALAARGLLPETHVVDAGYVDAALRARLIMPSICSVRSRWIMAGGLTVNRVS